MNLVPLNLAEEKKKFFFDPQYNPQFLFEKPIPHSLLYEKYGEFGGELISKSTYILESVLKQWGSESEYLEEVEGKILSQDEASKIITTYLSECGLEKKVTLTFSHNNIARTHIDGFTMHIRLPIEYRERGIIGMLHHEIGTHVYRRLNDQNQLWYKKRDEYKLSDYMESEEGLASLHYYLNMPNAYMWVSALQYYACNLAKTMSFSQVFGELKKYIDDKERRFKITLRSKRGIADTSMPGGYTKDQVYLRGVVKMATWLKDNNFDITKLYIGKVSVEDLAYAWKIHPTYEPILPAFFTNDKKQYKETIQRILKLNGFL